VILDLRNEAELREGHARLLANLRAHGIDTIDGTLVARQIGGGVELALGLHRDPEMGLVVMAGSGGVLLELMKDVAFAAPPIDRAKALGLLSRTRSARLLAGFRGAPREDLAAAAAALEALGRLAADLGDRVASIDVNPFVALPEGQGGLALDAMVVLRGPG